MVIVSLPPREPSLDSLKSAFRSICETLLSGRRRNPRAALLVQFQSATPVSVRGETERNKGRCLDLNTDFPVELNEHDVGVRSSVYSLRFALKKCVSLVRPHWRRVEARSAHESQE